MGRRLAKSDASVNVGSWELFPGLALVEVEVPINQEGKGAVTGPGVVLETIK